VQRPGEEAEDSRQQEAADERRRRERRGAPDAVPAIGERRELGVGDAEQECGAPADGDVPRAAQGRRRDRGAEEGDDGAAREQEEPAGVHGAVHVAVHVDCLFTDAWRASSSVPVPRPSG
jgi:hypothetical protein